MGLMDLRLIAWAGRARSICLTRSWRFPSRVLVSLDNRPCNDQLLVEGVQGLR